MIIREKYLSKIRPFYDQDLIKVITGIRRCGKSVILTQIIDELHQRSGVSEERIAELHGSACRFRCIKNGHSVPVDLSHGMPKGTIHCQQCHSRIRPDCVLFSESLSDDVFNRSYHWVNECLMNNGIMIIVGSAGEIFPACQIPLDFMNRHGKTIEINIQPSGFTQYVDCFIQGPAGVILPEIVNRVIQLSSQQHD